MTYFCFVESTDSDVPHMEPLEAVDTPNALEEARRLLSIHSSGIAAHVFFGGERVETIIRDTVAVFDTP